jgi:hypothetical protein
MRSSYYGILDETKKALRVNRNRAQRNRDFQDLLNEKDISWIDAPIAKRPYGRARPANISIAKEIWRDKSEYVITKKMQLEIRWIKRQCRRFLDGKRQWHRPITHIVLREHDIGSLTDASVKRGLHGWCWTFQLWWQYSWEDIHPDIQQTLINEYIRWEKKLTCINVLELLGIFVAEVAIVVAYETEFHSMFKWQVAANG